MAFGENDILVETLQGSGFGGNDVQVDTLTPGLYEGMSDKTEIADTSQKVFNLSSELSLPLDTVEFNYIEMSEISDPDDLPEPEEEQPLEISALPEERSLLKSIFGYEGLAKPEYYWNMNPVKRAAFDAYMAGRHILTRVGGKIVTEVGIANTKEVHDLYNDELVNNPQWFQKSPELLGWTAEFAAEVYALRGLFKVTGLSRVLTTAGTKLAKPFLMTEITKRGGQQVLKTLSKEGLKRLGKDGLVAFLKHAPENTAFMTTWFVGKAALTDEDKSEAALAGTLWGVGLSAIAPAAGIVGKVFIATKAGASVRLAASRAYTELWRKFPRLMNAGRRPFSDEFLAESKKQFRSRFGVEPTTAETAKLKKITREVGKEMTKAAEKEAILDAYWKSGAKKAKDVAKEAAEVAKEAVAKPPVKPVPVPPVAKVPVKAIKVPPKAKPVISVPEIAKEVGVTKPDILSGVETGKPVSIDVVRGFGRKTKGEIFETGEGESAFGEGRYSAIDEEVAKFFGPKIEKLTVQLDNPFVLTNDAQLVELVGEPIPREDALRPAFLRKARAAIEALGHDGIIINIPKFGDVDITGKSAKRLIEISGATQVVEFFPKVPPKAVKPVAEVKIDLEQQEVLKFMTPKEQQKAFDVAIKSGDVIGIDKEEFIKTFGGDIFNAKTGEPIEIGGAVIIEKPLRQAKPAPAVEVAEVGILDLKNLSDSSDKLTAEIDDLIDKVREEKGLTFEQADKDPEVKKLSDKRDEIDLNIAREYGNRIKKVLSDNGVDISIENQTFGIASTIYFAPLIRKDGGINPSDINLMFDVTEHIFSEDRQKTIDKLAKRLIKDHLWKTEAVTPDFFFAAAPKLEKTKMIEKFKAKANKIHTEIENAFAKVPTKRLPAPAEPVEPVPPQEPRLIGEREAGATTIIPDITTEVSETSKRLGSTLKSAIKGARELLSRNVLRYTAHLRGLGKEGAQVANDFDEITQRAQKRINNNTLDATEILKGVNKENREKIAMTINGRLKEPPKWIQQRADRLRKVLDELLNAAKKLGVQRRVGGVKLEIAGTGKAFPQILNADGEKLLRQAGRHGINSPDVLAVAEEAVEEGFAKSVEEYIAALQHFRDRQLRGISGYLERERIELPERFLEWDPDRVLSNLFQKNWLFIEGVRQWGVDDIGLAFPKMAIQIEILRASHGSDEAKLLDQFVKAAFGRELLSSEASRKISATVRGYQFLTKIAISPLTITRNMLDRFNKVASFAPLSVQLKTLIQYPPLINAFMKHAKEIEEEMIRRGAVFSNTAIGEGYQPGHLLTKIAGKAFASSERGNQIYIALAKKNAIDANLKLLKQNPKIARIFDKRIGKLLSPLEILGKSPSQALIRLRELGNEDMLAKIQSVDDISPDLLDAILHKTVRDKAFPVVLSTKRSWWDNKPFVRMLTQFKVWGTDQIGHIWNDVIKDTVKHRDPSKIIGWLTAMAVTGEIYNILRDFILGKDESLLATLSDAERRNARDISITILKDMIDGGVVGIFADVIYGLPNLIGGPSAQTLANMGDTTAKIIWNVSQAKDAIKQLAIKETPALRQAQSALDKVDARFDQKNLTKDYYKWRRRGWEWANKKKFPTLGDRAKEKAIKSLLGWTRRVPQERTLSYEMITRNILVGDTETASEFLFFLLKSADTPQEQESIERGIQTTLRKASPLGNIAEDDLGDFFKSMTAERVSEAHSLQLQWLVNVSEANSKAILKWQEWNREQR